VSAGEFLVTERICLIIFLLTLHAPGENVTRGLLGGGGVRAIRPWRSSALVLSAQMYANVDLCLSRDHRVPSLQASHQRL